MGLEGEGEDVLAEEDLGGLVVDLSACLQQRHASADLSLSNVDVLLRG